MNKIAILVKLTLPPSAHVEDASDYVEAAVRGWAGGQHPRDVFSDLDRSSVEVELLHDGLGAEVDYHEVWRRGLAGVVPIGASPKVVPLLNPGSHHVLPEPLPKPKPPAHLVCRKCVEAGEQSLVLYMGTETEQKGCQTYYRDGVSHNHDNDIEWTIYACRRFHSWKRSEPHTCFSCNFVSGTEEIVELPDLARGGDRKRVETSLAGLEG